MAVQAQYPSNALFLNSKNAQEGHDYSLQSPPVELLDHHQSHMLFNKGGTSSRKRGRETTGIAPNFVNSFSLQQSQSPQLIDLTQLHNQNNVVSTGLRLSFGDQQQLHHQQQHHGYHSNAFESLLSEDLSSQIKQQRDEIDQFLQAQGEQLRRTLTEKRQRHYRTLVRTAEEAVLRQLREKEAEVERVTRRNAELEARAAQLSMEAQVWEAKAKAQEAAAAALQAQLQQAMMGDEGGGGGLSCTGGDAEDAESAHVDPDRVGPKCRGCAQRLASVVVLPCRHLCFCAQCDTNFRACPVCLTVKNSTVQVFLS
ncbi:BOI-related E3 ubiquitin-protein ligase 1 [Cajanus cajan]|uniref:Baculoviral IAP repeat-containing protein 2 n=1 Tax=Cajanus cajan TaxID=3821 RepID=A0A151TJA0_CAJCA|nr:BOI-related E3 ubiquitin-protein ligase 1 [Cajanus cajan]KYP67099.1 Baculoviral IAP repeat-containing protein 2 [Cajanus cajan]